MSESEPDEISLVLEGARKRAAGQARSSWDKVRDIRLGKAGYF